MKANRFLQKLLLVEYTFYAYFITVIMYHTIYSILYTPRTSGEKEFFPECIILGVSDMTHSEQSYSVSMALLISQLLCANGAFAM